MQLVVNDGSAHCAQACIAMIRGTSLNQVLAETGSDQLLFDQTIAYLNVSGFDVYCRRFENGRLNEQAHAVNLEDLAGLSVASTYLVRLLPMFPEEAAMGHLFLIAEGQVFDSDSPTKAPYPLSLIQQIRTYVPDVLLHRILLFPVSGRDAIGKNVSHSPRAVRIL